MITTNAAKAGDQLEFKLDNGISLLWRKAGSVLSGYPVDRMQKGWLLAAGNKVLDEEGTGFGVPIIKFKHETVLPGDALLKIVDQNDIHKLTATFILNLVKRKIIKGKPVKNKLFYRLNESFASVHRNVPELRRIHSWLSHGLSNLGDIKSRLEMIDTSFMINVTYTIHPGNNLLHVSVDPGTLTNTRDTKLMMTNEQGASYFNTYKDSDGVTLINERIGTWNPIFTEQASFIDSRNGISFALKNIPGVSMYRGRESETRQLAWSGIAYEVPLNCGNFEYDITLGSV